MSEQLYPIRFISEQSGVKPVTLRAWETRYNILRPHRTEKGHRLYTQADLDKVNRIVALINRGATISQAIESLNDKGGYELIADNEHKFLINYSSLNKAVLGSNYQAVNKELNAIYADYSPEAFAQVIYPAIYKELTENVWSEMPDAEISREIFLDLVIHRLMTNILENNNYANQQTIQVVGFRTGMIKPRVIHGLFIASILKVHGFKVVFCSGVSSIETISEYAKNAPTVVFTYADSFYIKQLDRHIKEIKEHTFLWSRHVSNDCDNLITLNSDYTSLYEQVIKHIDKQGLKYDG